MKLAHIFHGWNLGQEEKFLKTPVGIFLLGAFLGELSPDPTDAIHFWIQNHVFTNPALSSSFKAMLEVFDWYFLTASYFLFLLVCAYLLHIRKVQVVQRVTVIGGIISIGIVIGLIAQVVSS